MIIAWEYRSGGPNAEETQVRCLESALRAIDASEVVVGAFLWKWLPASRRGENFLLNTTAMQTVIGEAWRGRPAVDSIDPARRED